MTEGFLDANAKIHVTFRLHELIALGLLWERASADLDLTDDDGNDFGTSADLAVLRIAEAISKHTGNIEGLLRGGAIRARLDQEMSGGA